MSLQWARYSLIMLSALTVGGAAVRPDIEYGRAGDFILRMDASIPESKGPFPAVVIVHGGGWVGGSRDYNVEPLFRPLSQAGFAWFSVSYRLAAELPLFGAAIDDVQAAVQYVKAHSGEFKIDPNRVALVGESAGAQLASMAALTATPESAVKAVVSFYNPSDLVNLVRNSTMIPPSIRQAVQGGPWAELLLMRLRQLSPVTHVRRDMPPFLLIHGTADRLVPFEQSAKFCADIRKAGGQCDLLPVNGAVHGIRRWEASKDFTMYKQYMVDWLAKQLAEPHLAELK
ncbi:MAG TPA: alpha/beta hydrolase [Bryobacteraceae bacterium]|nr:alpha/beta hydrolase [Bryobacteraceae bacterium]